MSAKRYRLRDRHIGISVPMLRKLGSPHPVAQGDNGQIGHAHNRRGHRFVILKRRKHRCQIANNIDHKKPHKISNPSTAYSEVSQETSRPRPCFPKALSPPRYFHQPLQPLIMFIAQDFHHQQPPPRRHIRLQRPLAAAPTSALLSNSNLTISICPPAVACSAVQPTDSQGLALIWAL